MHYTLLCNKIILLHASSHTSNKQFLQNPHHQGSPLAALPFPAQGQTRPDQTSAYRRDASPTAGAAVLLISSHPPLAVSPSPPRSRLSAPSYFFLLLVRSTARSPPLAARSLPTYRTTPPTASPSHTLPLSLAPPNPPRDRACAAPRCVAVPVPAPKSEATERAAVPSAQAEQATSGSPPPRPPPPALPRRSTWTFFVLSVSRRPLTCLDSVRSDLLCFFSMVLREKSNPTDAPST
jgi:hypothetical protein